MKRALAIILSISVSFGVLAQKQITIRKKDRKRDVELVTSYGTIILRLSDSTPLHRDNFLRMVKQGYYDSVLFHRVIRRFMIQTGDPESKRAEAGRPLGNGNPGYTIPAEFRQSLFHQKGAVAAARESDDLNPLKASSGSQFYIVQGRIFSEGALDTLEVTRLRGRKIPPAQREVYKTIGGAPHLDQNYTVFGNVVSGLEIVDQIAAAETSKDEDRDRPLKDIRIISTRLIKRK
jgi:cyclophilin family peptidyl-prolyl cis-trans isomerase